MRQDSIAKEIERIPIRKWRRSADVGEARSSLTIRAELVRIDAVWHHRHARCRGDGPEQSAIVLRYRHVQRDSAAPAPLDLFHERGLKGKIRLAPALPLDCCTAPKERRFDIMMNAHDRKTAASREVGGQVEAIEMNEIESVRLNKSLDPRAKCVRLVQKRRINAACRDAAEVIPSVPQAAVLLRNRKHFDVREPAERRRPPCDAPIDLFPCARGTFETERGDVEGSGKQSKDVVGPDPHAAVREGTATSGRGTTAGDDSWNLS